MRIKAILSFALAVAGISGAQAAPSQLLGKSIKMSWNESSEQRRPGVSDFHGLTTGQYLTIYVSPTGKLFNRWIATNRGQAGSSYGTNDQVAGEAGSGRGLSFHGNQLEVFNPFAGGMRHLVVSFDASFGSCTMKASYPSDKAGGPKINHGLVNGGLVELRNASGSGESCSIQDGNAFAH
jgi:hypothetical protein